MPTRIVFGFRKRRQFGATKRIDGRIGHQDVATDFGHDLGFARLGDGETLAPSSSCIRASRIDLWRLGMRAEFQAALGGISRHRSRDCGGRQRHQSEDTVWGVRQSWGRDYNARMRFTTVSTCVVNVRTPRVLSTPTCFSRLARDACPHALSLDAVQVQRAHLDAPPQAGL